MARERQNIFQDLLNILLTDVKSNNNVQLTTHNVSDILEQYPIPDPVTYLSVQHKVDPLALALLPLDAPDLSPVCCTANGNCLFNAVSILLCGNESMAAELRVRASIALIQLEEEFTNSSGDPVRQLIHEQAVLYAPFGSTDYTVNASQLIDQEIQIIFHNEVISTLTDCAWSSMWQIIALATALQMSVWSIYPNYNYRVRNLFNKLVLPLLNLETTMFILPIMWTGYVDHSGFHPNHFVPLVPNSYLHHQYGSNMVNTSALSSTVDFPVRSDDCTLQINNKPIIQNFLKLLSAYSSYCTSCQKRILTKRMKTFKEHGPVCNYCYRYLKDEKQSPLNIQLMYPGDIPDELSNLNLTEIKLISQVHPYMNLVSLPSGGQHGLKGQSINLPVPMQTICASLPRNEESSPLVKIYSAKSQDYYETVNIISIDKALAWLQKNNIQYKDIILQFLSNEDIKCSTSDSQKKNNSQDVDMEEVALIPIDYQVHLEDTKFVNTFKMPIIPGTPVNIFSSPNLEELAFPQLYPYGTHGLHYERPVQPSFSEYFKCRLLNKDRRWISTPQYIFWALHIYEQEKLQNAITTALRSRTKTNERLCVEDVASTVSIDYKTDNYMFMKKVRGTAAYWKNELTKLMAKIRTLGPPTFFMSLSANDVNWEDNLKFIDPSLTDDAISKLSYADRCKIIRENPISSAIHFNNRWESFLHHHLLTKPYPLGYISDYFARIEFQSRGSPHLHILLWIADAPNFETDKGDILVAFIDRYINGRIPEDESNLSNLVKSLQMHNHTFTCQRYKSSKCRFDFPMPISEETRMKFETDTGSSIRFYILKRSISDIYVNPYNENILSNWQANMDIQVVGSMYAVAKYVCTYICKNEPLEFRQSVSACLNGLPNGSSQRKIMSKIGNILLTHRTIGLQEAAYRLLGLDMVYSSRDTIFVNSSLPDRRYRILKKRKELEELPSGSTDIYTEGMVQYYLYRPRNEIFTNMCLAEFVTNYKLTNYIPKKDSMSLPRFKINVRGETKIIMQRSKTACLRYYIPDILLDKEGYFYCLLYLFLPFYSETEIKQPYETYQEAFECKKYMLDQSQLQKTNLLQKFSQAVQHLLHLSQDDMDNIHSLTTPSYQNIKDETNAEGITDKQDIFNFDILKEKENSTEKEEMNDFNISMFKKLAQSTMTENEYQQNKAMLTDTQQKVFTHIETHDNKSPLYLFITGGAGTGKSFLLRLIREQFLRKNMFEFPNVLVAAPTGVAAYHIKGHTLHTLLQLPTQNKSNATYRPLAPRTLKFLQATFKHVQYLIIDEVSMVSYNTLEHIHLRLNEVKGHYLDPDAYFGNISIITFGDLYQLRPVFGSPIYSDKAATKALHLWKDFFTMFELTENKRQCRDPDYAEILNRIRVGEHTLADIKILQTRLLSPTQNQQELLHIFPLKQDRDKYNEGRIKHMTNSNDIYEIKAVHNVDEKYIPHDDQKCAGIPRTIMLCVNARVMLIRNIDTQNGLVNGAQGTVHSIEWEDGHNSSCTMPRCVNVLFDDRDTFEYLNQSVNQPVGIKPITVCFLGHDSRYISRTQIPLVLSFATTIHKVQGLTLADAVCDLGPTLFTGGMAYVALSRVSTLNDIYLSNLCPPRIYPCKDVTLEMDRLRQKSSI